MMGPLCRFSAPLPKVDMGELLRYAACREADEATMALCHLTALEGGALLRPQLMWREVAVSVRGHQVDMEFTCVDSEKLAKHLAGCEKAVVFAATVGLELDRRIARTAHTSPARALLLDALGSERIEALCDLFCAHLAERYAPLAPRPRFSPGYGGWPLQGQRDVFAALDCERQLGLYLTDSLLMSPVKSVTAVVGLGGGACCRQGCAACENKGCDFRR